MKFFITYITFFCVFFYVHASEFDSDVYYQEAEGKQQYELKTALHKIIRGHTRVSYTPGIWQA